MFYDEVFRQILETSAFSEEAVLTVKVKVGQGASAEETSSSYTLRGFFCSGSYGQDDFDKGYTLRKTVKRQSFKISLDSLPSEVNPAKLARQKLAVHGKDWTIDEVTGNESGILELSLKAKGGDRG